MRRFTGRLSAVMAAAVLGIPGWAWAQQVAQGDKVEANEVKAEALLDQRVTFDLAGVPLESAIQKVASLAHATVLIDHSAVSRYDRAVTLRAKDESLRSVFERLFAGTPLTVVARQHAKLIVTDASDGRSADSTSKLGVITGRVVDSATGRGVNGATIKVVGTKISAVSADSGRFLLSNVPVGDRTLTTRAFGYRPQERAVTVASDVRATVRILLAAAPNVLSGVVTTASGVQDRLRVGNDITVINADSVLRIAPVTNLTELLEGRVPGLTVTHTSGIPGAPSRIRLRGIGGGLVPGASNTSNDPIVIVDGVRRYAQVSTARDQSLAPGQSLGVRGTDVFAQNGTYLPPSALDQIDINSIETVEVFKGPSATAEWGADAGNGVIVITTKRGHSGQTRVSAMVSAGVEQLPGTYAAPGYYAFGTYDYANQGGGLCTSVTGAYQCVRTDSVARFQGANASRLSPFATGTQKNASLTVSGGTPVLAYSFTGAAGDHIGYVKMPDFFQDAYRDRYSADPPFWARRPTRYRNWSADGKTDVVPTPGLRVSVATSVFNDVSNQTSADNTLSVLSGTYLDTVTLRAATPGVAVAKYLQQSTSQSASVTNSATADWTRWSKFPMSVTAGTNTIDRRDHITFPFGFEQLNNYDTLGQYAMGHGTRNVRTGSAHASLFKDALVSTDVGVQFVKTTSQDFMAYRDSLQPGITVPALFDRSGQSSFSTTTAGWFVAPHLNMGSRFFLNPAFRFDGGSAASGKSRGNGRGGLLAFFPHLDFSWLVIDRGSERPFAGFVSLFRPRLGFGVAGVQPDPSWRLRLLQTSTGGTAPIQGATISSLGNTQLHPERSRELESGFEAVLWNGRATINTSTYYKLRIDAIEQVGTAPSVDGGQGYYLNIGRVRNTGLELQVEARPIETAALAWSVNMSLSADKNVITSLYQGVPTCGGCMGGGLVVGYPVNGLWARPILGYHDRDGDGRLTLADVAVADSSVYVGAASPKVEIPFGTNLALFHGRFGINAEFDYKGGVTQYNLGGAALLANVLQNPAATLGEQAVALTALSCSLILYGGSHCDPTYDLFQTVSVLRFQSVSLNYVVPRAASAKLRLPAMTVALQGNNLALWSNYRGKDPDVNASTLGEGLQDAGQIPEARSWSIKFTLGN